MDGQIIRTSAEVFGFDPDEEEGKKKRRKSLLRKSSEVFDKPEVLLPVTPQKPTLRKSSEVFAKPQEASPLRPQIQPTAGMPATVEQKGIVRPSIYKRPSVLHEPATGQKVANVLYKMGVGMAEEALLNIPQWPRGDEASEYENISEGVGRFAGFIIGAPMKLGKLGYNLLYKGLKKPATKLALKVLGKETPALGKVFQRISSSAFQLGLGSALSEIEDVKGMPERFKSGAVFGSIFGAGAFAHMKKMPVLSQMVRQFGTRALARTAKLYQLPYENIEQWSTPEAAQRVFDELLFSVFSAKPVNKNKLFADLRKIEREVQRSGMQIQVWSPYQDPQMQAAMKKVPADFIVTGSGEVIPTKLFDIQPTMAGLVKVTRPLELPEYKPPKKLKPKKPKALTAAEKRRKMMEERKLIVTEKPKPPIEKELPTGEELAAEIEKFAKTGKIEKIPPSEELGKREGFERRKEELAFKEGEVDLKEYYSGLHFPKLLVKLDKHLQRKFVIEPVQQEFQRKTSREITPVVREAIREDAEKMPIMGHKVRLQLRRFGKPGKKIADMADNFVRNHSQHIQEDVFKLQGARAFLGKDISWAGKKLPFERTSQQIVGKMYDLLEGKKKPATANEQAAYDILKPLFDKFATKSKALDVKVSTMFGDKDFQPIKDYAPVEYKGIKRFLSAKGVFRHLHDWYIEEIAKTGEAFKDIYKVDPAKAIKAAKGYYKEFRSDLKTRPFGHLEMQRLLDETAIERLRIRWQKNFPNKPFPLERKKTFDVLVKYIVGANNRLDWIEQFGKDVEWKSGQVIPEKLLEVSADFEKTRSRDWTFRFFQQYLRQTAPYEPFVVRLIRGIRTAQLTKLAFAWIPNSLQFWTNDFPKTPIKAIPRVLWDSAKYYGLAGKKNKAKAKEWFSKTGAETLKQAVQLAMMENPSKVNAMADIMLKLHLFSGTEFNNALMSASAGKWRAIIMSERLFKKGAKSWRAPFYRAELKKLGLSEADIERVIKDGPLTPEDVKTLANASFYQRRSSQFLANAFELPKFWSTPAGRLLTQFKNFAYNQTSMLYEEGVKEAYKFIKSGIKTRGRAVEGDLTKIMKWAVVLPAAGAIVTKFKEAGFKKIGIHFYEELMAGKSWPFKMMVYIANTGNLGLAMDVLTSFKYGKASLVPLIGGPTASDIGEFWQALSGTWNELEVAFKNKNLKWLKQRSKTIRDYWLRFGERLSPDMRVPIHNLFEDYRKLKTMANWTRIYTSMRRKYRQLYKLKSPSAANELWNAWMQTQGTEYRDLFNRMPQRPTRKEVERWWREQAEAKSGRMQMPGKKTGEGFTFWY